MKQDKKISMLAKQLCHARTCTVKSNDNECCYKNCQAFKYAQRIVDLGIDANCINNDQKSSDSGFEKIKSAATVLCGYCEEKLCTSCMVGKLVELAHEDCEVPPFEDDEE